MTPTLHDKLRAFDPTLPLERAHTIPNTWYFDQEIYEAEGSRVFANNWLAVGRADAVATPGSFFTLDLAGEPLLVIRGDDGALRAFHNVCRHRAAPLLTQEQGCVSKLRCRYHGWTYDLTGRLRGTPEFDGVCDFAKDANGLVELAAEVWGPLVFVHPGTPGQSLSEYLSPLPGKCSGLGLEQMKFVERRSYDLACNWKVYVDNYLDGGYHINSVHTGLGSVLDYSRYTTTVAGNTVLQDAPLKSFGQGDAAYTQVRTGAASYYWWVFPHLMVNIYTSAMDTNLVLPLGPDRCRVVFDFYFTQTEGEATRKYITDSIAVSHEVQEEDVGICEEVQRGLASRAFTTGRFSVKRENGGYAFHQMLAERLRGTGEA
jgi:choline monooxygenase